MVHFDTLWFFMVRQHELQQLDIATAPPRFVSETLVAAGVGTQTGASSGGNLTLWSSFGTEATRCVVHRGSGVKPLGRLFM